jgi:hypothetical protein
MDEKKLIYEEDYLGKFETNKINGELTVDAITKEALEKALDIRKFEIDLYWKRATYFWGFLIVIFAGYFAVLGSKLEYLSYRDKLLALLLISCLGFIFSYCWFLVNKGSKYWQNNWERHVDMLEDEIMGPLYKTVIDEENKKGLINYITSAEEYSVSKVNQTLSYFLVIIWSIVCLGNIIKIGNDYIVNDLGKIWFSNQKVLHFPFFEIGIIFLTIFFYIVLKKEGKSSHKKGSNKKAHFKIRDKALSSRYPKKTKSQRS